VQLRAFLPCRLTLLWRALDAVGGSDQLRQIGGALLTYALITAAPMVVVCAAWACRLGERQLAGRGKGRPLRRPWRSRTHKRGTCLGQLADRRRRLAVLPMRPAFEGFCARRSATPQRVRRAGTRRCSAARPVEPSTRTTALQTPPRVDPTGQGSRTKPVNEAALR